MFTPDRRTVTRQLMCSRACGAHRRRAQALARRAADLEGHRDAERDRQRSHRQRVAEEVRACRAAPPAVEIPAVAAVEDLRPAAGMSRADFAAEVRAITLVIVANVDKAAALSRAEFGRQVVRIVKEGAQNLGRACA
jgi:hypothetical protein